VAVCVIDAELGVYGAAAWRSREEFVSAQAQVKRWECATSRSGALWKLYERVAA
jgi:hypothetical protein